VRRKCISLVPADFGRTDTARFAVEPAEAYHRADTHTELLRNFRNCVAMLPRPHYAYPQILRIGLPHPILAPSPARVLNPIRVRMGIPLDSIFSGNALAERHASALHRHRSECPASRPAGAASNSFQMVPLSAASPRQHTRLPFLSFLDSAAVMLPSISLQTSDGLACILKIEVYDSSYRWPKGSPCERGANECGRG